MELKMNILKSRITSPSTSIKLNRGKANRSSKQKLEAPDFQLEMTFKEDGLLDKRSFAKLSEGQKFKLVSIVELEDEMFRLRGLNDVRKHLLEVPPCTCMNKIDKLYCDLNGVIINDSGEEVFVDSTELLDIVGFEWFRDTVKKDKPRTTAIRLRSENRERIRLILTIFRACFPEDAIHWNHNLTDKKTK